MTSDAPAPTPESGIASAKERLRSLQSEARRVAAEVEAHVREHEAQIEAHKREVAAAKAMLVEFMPGVDKKSAEAAAFINWRYVAFVVCALVFWKMLF
jgi:hypothetical protein